MPDARQLCKASQSVASTLTATTCPTCGRKVTVNSWVWIFTQGKRERRPVIPAHVRDEEGERKTKMLTDRTRYPGTS